MENHRAPPVGTVMGLFRNMLETGSLSQMFVGRSQEVGLCFGFNFLWVDTAQVWGSVWT